MPTPKDPKATQCWFACRWCDKIHAEQVIAEKIGWHIDLQIWYIHIEYATSSIIRMGQIHWENPWSPRGQGRSGQAYHFYISLPAGCRSRMTGVSTMAKLDHWRPGNFHCTLWNPCRAVIQNRSEYVYIKLRSDCVFNYIQIYDMFMLRLHNYKIFHLGCVQFFIQEGAG